MRQIVDWSKHYDIIVAGGGLAGAAAAIAAARNGCRVVIVERYGCLGGMAATALVNPFMVYCQRNRDLTTAWEAPVNAGIFAEILKRLTAMGELLENRITFNEEALKLILDQMISENHIEVLFHSFVMDVELEGRKLNAVVIAGKGGLFRIMGKYFVDATGDADVTVLAGCPTVTGNEEGLTQPMTTCFRVMNVDTEKYAPRWSTENCHYHADGDVCRDYVNPLFHQAVEEGTIHNPSDGVSTHPSILPGVMHFNSTRVRNVTPMDIEGMSKAEMEGRRQCYELYGFVKEHVPGFENSKYMNSGIQIGVRESRHIIGDYILTEDDIMNCVKFKDSIARGSYGIDIHSTRSGDKNGGTKDIPANDYYTLPYSILMPQGVDNLIVAGRPLSSTHLAHGAHRIMPICTSVGEAAGTAAYLAFTNESSFRGVKIGVLHKLLDKYGALY